MDQIKKLIATLSVWQRVAVVGAALLVPLGIFGVLRWHHEQDFRPLFTGMSPDDAAAVVQKIKESGSEYRLGDGGTSVLAPQDKVDELRLQLAAAGLPKTGRVGFELFDKTNLGITDFTEHVNYRRALEGELERSIRAISQIQQARVHITFAKDSVFLESREPAKASVLVDVRPGASLNSQNVSAIANLVASAVEGLSPSSVSIVNMRGELLNRPRQGSLDDGQMSDAALDYKHQIERDLASKVESTLEPLLGPGRFRVGVSVDCDFTSTEQSEEVYDPSRSVMVTSQVSEDSTAGAIQTAGIPGTQANSARPPAKPTAAPSTGVSRRTENVAYDTTRTIRHVKVPQGAVKRISASVLLDEVVQWQGTGKKRRRVLTPVPASQMAAIRDLVSGALGLVKDRDQLVLESLPFEETLSGNATEDGPPPSHSLPQLLTSDRRTYIIGGVSGAVILASAVFFALRRRKGIASAEVRHALSAPAAETALAGEVQKLPAQEPIPAIAAFQLPPVEKKVEVVRDRLRESVTNDPQFMVNVLRGWLDEEAPRLRERNS
jgi:flagellar M-ring protein FliF